jgi:hypothetical protein
VTPSTAARRASLREAVSLVLGLALVVLQVLTRPTTIHRVELVGAGFA